MDGGVAVRRVAWITVLLAGCGWDLTTHDGLVWLTMTRHVGADGRIPILVDVPANATSLQVVGDMGTGKQGYMESLTNASGDKPFVAQDTWDGVHNRTNAGFSSDVVVMDWPIAESDGALTAGTLRFDLRSADHGDVVPITVAIKQDDDLTSGVLTVDLVYAGTLEDDPVIVAATEAAIEHWRDIYAAIGIEHQASGIELVVVERAWDGPARLSSPGYGDADLYREALADKPPRSVSVLVIDKVTDVAGVFGVSGGIPGSLIPTDRSVVSVSAREHAGKDGAFSADEIQLFGETMAHEVGHYLGLFHPAELPVGGVVKSWDALDDTPECLTGSDCDAKLGSNLMYPTPLCDSSPCTPQSAVTAQQEGIVQRYVGVE